MYFKKLELVGFKSFLNKTALDFEPGVTAVVGPNGCGKSNIFDSIRWVLGEQSAKALRGSDMQDVIFNGTDTNDPLSMAEVSLTFDNDKKFFSVDHDEVVISRRIFRSGESEYLLNKVPVRLKDILDLLSGTGIGSEGYSLVEQGKIDLILSARPEDRRLVFDEASGIVKYKAQKKEALRKLEETDLNLTRVSDIIAEVKRQIGSLERQANKARRYKEVFEELKSKEINLAILQKIAFLKEKDEIIKQLKDLESQEAELLSLIKEEEAKIGNRQTELKTLEDKIMGIKNEILNINNLVTRNRERINFNQEKTQELEETKRHLEIQVTQTKNRLLLDEEKLNNFKVEYGGIKKNIETKSIILKEKGNGLNALGLAIRTALENIAQAKKGILDLVTKITNTKNEITDLSSRQQIHLARKKRLEMEKAKVGQEKSVTEDNLKSIKEEVENLEKFFGDLNRKISHFKNELEQENIALNHLNKELGDLEKELFTLSSQREFLEKLRTKYEDIGESMNATVYLDKPPKEKVTGLVVRIKNFQENNLKLSGEAKPIDLDTKRICEQMQRLEQQLAALKNTKATKETRIQELDKHIQDAAVELRNQELALVNKQAFSKTVLEQFNKIKGEEDLLTMELEDVDSELPVLGEKLTGLGAQLSQLNNGQRQLEDSIIGEQNNITSNNNLKEQTLIIITQTKTELDALARRIGSDEATLKILEGTYLQDQEHLLHIENQIKETEEKKGSLILEDQDMENKIKEADQFIETQKELLKDQEAKYQKVSDGAGDWNTKMDADRKKLDTLKDKLYELQMRNKDVDYKITSAKERIFQGYKIDLQSLGDIPQESDENILSQEIKGLKEKLDSYGTVNLVAIEEYDELKKRYDFLTQQQNDLNLAKESLHKAILKINQTTKKMFLETFEKVRDEFRNYFRLLFGGGDSQVFLIDEQDPLESGIEIICRPPGKKLQNVLLLSGGEKALSAIALIFAIFKVKPSPFCVLDEIDAALDEANVDRFSRILQEFTHHSQFIVITHNKRTIANADVMYGITMEESGVSKIVSVKFAQKVRQVKQREAKEPQVAQAESVS